jgi:DNA-binding transcriptional LysR family regulator
MRGTEFAELSAFVAVAEHTSFTRAAAHLGIATATLSQSIRKFEERLGVRLLNRTTRSVSLTAAGERLLADAQPILDGISQAVEGVNSFRDRPIGTLRLSMPRPAAWSIMAPVVPQFLSTYPEIKLEISADDGHHDIVSGRFDAGIQLGERIAKDMIAVRLLDQFRRRVVAAPAYLATHPRPSNPEDLKGHDCVRLRSDWDGALQPWVFERADGSVEVAVDGTFIVNDLYLALRAVLGGVGIGYLPEPLIAPFLQSSELVPLLGDWCGHFSGIFLYYSSRRQVPGPLRAFIEFMRARTKEFNAAMAPKIG